MKALPIKARFYIVATSLAGFLVFAYSQLLSGPRSADWQVVVFLAISLVAGGTKIPLSSRLKNTEAGSMSLGFAIALATLLKCGPVAAILVNAGSTLWSCLYPKRQASYQVAFNVSTAAIEATLGGLVYMALRPTNPVGHTVESFTVVTGTTLTYFAVNTFSVAIVIGLCSDKNPFAIWRENFVWTAPSYLATACVTALAMSLFNSFSALILFVIPVAYLVYQSYKTYISKNEEKERHIEELQISKATLADLYLATIKSLALAIDAKDQYTHQHILRVQRYAVAIAKHMGLCGSELEAVNTGALLHDIGKLGVPEYVLIKPGRLTPEEFDKIKKHPEIGEAILDPVEFPWPVLPVVRSHHEKWNGTGYPDGLKAEEIPLTARIMAVADVYDALTSSRSYRQAWTHERAVETIKKDAGTHFDPVVVDAFLEVIDGVVREMAKNGEGPLAPPAPILEREVPNKARQAAAHISRSSTELWALYEVAQTLSSSLGIQDTVDFLCRKLEKILPGSLCLFLLREEGGTAMTVAAAVGVNAPFFAGARTISLQSSSVRSLESQAVYSGEYDADDLLISTSGGAVWCPLSSAVIVPISFEGRPLGTINCYHPERDAFSTHDIHLLEMIAERAAQPLYNSLLFERTRGHAMTDSLTGVYNLRATTERIETMCSEGVPFAVLCMDLDSFKPINDNFGHQKGDEVLKELTKLFATVLDSGTNSGADIKTEPGDLLGRYGGDEFLAVLNDANRKVALATAHRISVAVEQFDPELYHTLLGHLRIGVSIGYACFPEHGTDCASLVAAADADMYRVKMERKLRALASSPARADHKKAS